jgi:hypothetical protein
MFLILGIPFAIRGETSGLLLLMLPVTVGASISHARRILKAVAEIQSRAFAGVGTPTPPDEAMSP